MPRNSYPPLNGGAIRAARLRKFLTQYDVERRCAELGCPVDNSNLSKMERGLIRWPSPKILPVLAEVLGVNVEDLFADDEANGGKAA